MIGRICYPAAGARGEQNNKQERESQSAYQLSLHLLPLPPSAPTSRPGSGWACVIFSLSLPLTAHKLPLSSHLSYGRIKRGHFKVLPHPKVPRGRQFSPCLGWKGPIHHRLFVTKAEERKHTLAKVLALFARECVGAIRTCQMHGDDKRGRVRLFQHANTMTGTSTACTLLINPHFTPHWEPK